jgi:hypothetical protein
MGMLLDHILILLQEHSVGPYLNYNKMSMLLDHILILLQEHSVGPYLNYNRMSMLLDHIPILLKDVVPYRNYNKIRLHFPFLSFFFFPCLLSFPALPDFLKSSGSGTESTQPREYN